MQFSSDVFKKLNQTSLGLMLFVGCPCGILFTTMQGLINVLEKKKKTLKDIATVNVMKEVGDRY